METMIAILAGLMMTGSVFLMLGRHLVRFIFGLVLASNAVNLLIFAAGRFENTQPPLIPDHTMQLETAVANSLPQALVLTAIVIGFALLVFVFILFYRAFQTLGTVNTEEMTDADKIAGEQRTLERAKT